MRVSGGTATVRASGWRIGCRAESSAQHFPAPLYDEAFGVLAYGLPLKVVRFCVGCCGRRYVLYARRGVCEGGDDAERHGAHLEGVDDGCHLAVGELHEDIVRLLAVELIVAVDVHHAAFALEMESDAVLAVVTVEALPPAVVEQSLDGVCAEGEVADNGVIEGELGDIDIHLLHAAVSVGGDGVGDAVVGVGVGAAYLDGDGTCGGHLPAVVGRLCYAVRGSRHCVLRREGETKECREKECENLSCCHLD